MIDTALLVLVGLAIGVAVAAPIGAVGVMVIRRALSARPWAGVVAGLGAALGDAIYAGVAGFGLSAVLHPLARWQAPLRVGGGLVVIVVGVVLLMHRRAPGKISTDDAGAPALLGHRPSFFAALALTLGNPVALLSFLAIFAATGVHHQDLARLSIAIVVGSVFLSSSLWFAFLSYSAHALSRRYGSGVARGFDAVAAVLLISLGTLALLLPVQAP